MDNRQAARTLFSIATILQLRDANRYRVAAYRRAALRLLALPDDASHYLNEAGELAVPWLGPRLRRKLGELIARGRMRFYDELLAELSPAERELLSVSGVGPKTAKALIEQLGIHSVRDLAEAARRQQLHRLRGIGPLRERRLGAAAEALLASAA